MRRLSTLALTVLATVSAVYAQRTVRMNIERLVNDAGIIIHGTVTRVEAKKDDRSNFFATFITLRVAENFYGATGEEMTLKVYAGRSGTIRLADMPRFVEGEEVYTMWYKPSSVGFSSPVGMQQGKFSVRYDSTIGKTFVSNGVSNAGLFSGVRNRAALAKSTWTDRTREPIEAQDLAATIRSLVVTLKKK